MTHASWSSGEEEDPSLLHILFPCLCFNTRSVCGVSFAHGLTLPQLGTFWGGCLGNARMLTHSTLKEGCPTPA